MSDEIQIGRCRVRLTHPERVLFPADGVTKGDLAEYYVEIGDAIVPHLRDRPFTLKRYPHGIHGQPYFHKQAPKGKPSWIRTRRFRTWAREGGPPPPGLTPRHQAPPARGRGGGECVGTKTL